MKKKYKSRYIKKSDASFIDAVLDTYWERVFILRLISFYREKFPETKDLSTAMHQTFTKPCWEVRFSWEKVEHPLVKNLNTSNPILEKLKELNIKKI